MAFAAEYWGDDLTAAQRLSWDTYAAAIAMTNRLGETIHLSGFNHFVSSITAILAVGGTIVAAGPTTLTLPTSDPTFSVALSAANGITVTFDDTADWAAIDDGFMSIELGQPQNPSRTFFGGPWRADAPLVGDTAVPLTSPDGPTATSTWTLIETQIVYARARIIEPDGRVSNHFGHQGVVVGA